MNTFSSFVFFFFSFDKLMDLRLIRFQLYYEILSILSWILKFQIFFHISHQNHQPFPLELIFNLRNKTCVAFHLSEQSTFYNFDY